MDEYAIFNDEGLLESDFASQEEATHTLQDYDPEDGAYVAKVCTDHPEHEAATCELCNTETTDNGQT